MSKVYDNWERLIAAVLKRQKFRELALASSRETSFSSSSISSRFNSTFSFKFSTGLINDKHGEWYFPAAVRLAEQIVGVFENAASFKQEYLEIKSKAEKIAWHLRKAARANHGIYGRPANRIMDATKNVLQKAISLVSKCQGSKRVLATVNSACLQDIASQLEHSIANICWLLRDVNHYGCIPPIAVDEPVLCHVWELVAILHTGSVEDQCSAVASLVSLAHEGDDYRKLIIEEGCGIEPLLRLVHEGTPEVQENAVMVIALFAKRNKGGIDHKITSLFVKILKEGPLIKLQGTVAWAISELAENLSLCSEKYVHMLGHLAFKAITIYSLARENNLDDESETWIRGVNNRAIEIENLATGDYIKTMATKGLWHLALASAYNCRIIAESKALFCLAFILDKGPNEARYNSAMALTRITTFAKYDTEAFNRLPAYKSMIDQLLKIINDPESEILIPCIKVIGNLARTFKATETNMIGSLVNLLDERKVEVSKEACIALIKFAHSDNYLHTDHSKAVVNVGGVELLIQLVFSGEEIVRPSALKLLCYIALNVPGDITLTEPKLLPALEWASKQASLIQVEGIESLLLRVIEILDINQSTGLLGLENK